MTLTMLVASNYLFELTRQAVRYGNMSGASEAMFQSSVDFMYRNGGMKLLMAKTYDGSRTDEYWEGIVRGLQSVVTKTREGSGRGQGRSVFFEDITILFDLRHGQDTIDGLLAAVGFKANDDAEEEEEEE